MVSISTVFADFEGKEQRKLFRVKRVVALVPALKAKARALIHRQNEPILPLGFVLTVKKGSPQCFFTLGATLNFSFHVKHFRYFGMRMVRQIASSKSCRWQQASTPAERIMDMPRVTVFRNRRTSLIT